MNQELIKQPFESLVPHSGKMVLLDKVLAWDNQSISCSATSHKTPDNPLITGGELSIFAAVEYAAQAMAAHGWLLGTKKEASGKGFVAAVNKVSARVANLNEAASEVLIVNVKIIAVSEQSSRYQFEVFESGVEEERDISRALIEGQLLVVSQ